MIPQRMQSSCASAARMSLSEGPRAYVNLVWIISGFSCQSSMLTHIYNIVSAPAIRNILTPKDAGGG